MCGVRALSVAWVLGVTGCLGCPVPVDTSPIGYRCASDPECGGLVCRNGFCAERGPSDGGGGGAGGGSGGGGGGTPGGSDGGYYLDGGPLRAVMYRIDFPEQWAKDAGTPLELGRYDNNSGMPALGEHLKQLKYARQSIGVVRWNPSWTPRMEALLTASDGQSDVRWAVEDTLEFDSSSTDGAKIAPRLALIAALATHPSYLKIDGRFVVFAKTKHNHCDTPARWAAGNDAGAFLLIGVDPADPLSCSDPQWRWYQVVEGVSYFALPGHSAVANPSTDAGTRDPEAFRAAVKKMVSSQARVQLINSFNDWAGGSASESSLEFQTDSGFGAFLDVLHDELP